MSMVKICGLTNLEDARWAAGCGADLLGFVFAPTSPRFIEPADASRIIRALRDGGVTAQTVGVTVEEDTAAIRRAIQASGVDLVQLHGEGPLRDAQELGAPVILARRVRDSVPWEELRSHSAWAILLDSYSKASLGGTGETWRWDLLQERADRPERLIVAGGLNPTNVGDLIHAVRPWGVDVSSGVEREPGKKDAQKVQDFIENARVAFATGDSATEQED